MEGTQRTKVRLPRELKILFVDQNADLLEILESIAGTFGHQSKRAHNGREAMQVVAGWLPDLIFTSMRLGDCRGDELAGWLKTIEEASSIIMIMLTCEIISTLSSDTVGAFEHVIQKPFRIDELYSLFCLYSGDDPLRLDELTSAQSR